jgi:AbrB family looped-hinge helix DNA binding protein
MQSLTSVSSKGQLTLPASMRRALGIDAGTPLIIEQIDQRIIIKTQPNAADYYGFLSQYTVADTAIAKEQDKY